MTSDGEEGTVGLLLVRVEFVGTLLFPLRGKKRERSFRQAQREREGKEKSEDEPG